MEIPAVEIRTEHTSDGVTEREFRLQVEDREVPGLLWTGEHADSGQPLVLLGHGASGSKRQRYIPVTARWLIEDWGCAAVAIDGPAHGDREPPGASELREQDLGEWRRRYLGLAVTDAMVTDWRATIDALQLFEPVGRGPVGYWGLSLGTALGIPLVAAEPRIDAAVLGLMGSDAPGPKDVVERVNADARQISCPVLFMQQLHDELFSVAGGRELFDDIGSAHKRLHANPGGHAALVNDDALADEWYESAAFVGRHLRAALASAR